MHLNFEAWKSNSILLVLRNNGNDLYKIGSRHLGNFDSVLEEFKCGHSLNPLVIIDILSLVDVHLCEGNISLFSR